MSSKLDDVKENTPVQWYTFYSEKNGRDYYYEPNSKVVTWIRPRELEDEEQTHATVSTTPTEQETVIVERRVSFHESVNERHERNLDIQQTQDEKKRMPLVLLIVVVCALLLSASYMGWLPRGPLASFLVGRTLPKASTRPLKERRKQSKPRNRAKKPTIPRVPPQTEEERKRGYEEESHQAAHETQALHENVLGQITRRNGNTTTNQHDEPKRHMDTPKPRNAEANRMTTEPIKKEQPPASETVAMKNRDGNVSSKQDRRQENAPDEVKRNKGCLVPFAHVFSKKCRKMLAQKPVYDMDALLDSLI